MALLKNQLFRSRNGFAVVLGLSRAPFGSSWATLGSSEGLLDGPQRAPRFIMELSWAIFGDQKQPQETKEEQKQRKKTPQEGKEADGYYFSAKFADSIALFLVFLKARRAKRR